MTLDALINQAVQPITAVLSSIVFFSVTIGGAEIPLVVVWLVAGGVYFTLYFRFINIRYFTRALRIVGGDSSKSADHPGEVSHFQALATALSGTVGIGNIGGVAVAISVGGPGATFWMIVAGLLGMSTKFVECTLGVKYRREHEDGTVSGGPMYYLERGLAERGLVRLGKFTGTLYAIGIFIGCVGIGNMFQSNQAYAQFLNVTGTPWWQGRGWLFGSILALIVGFVIVGGLRSIVRVTEKIMPVMAVLYLGFAAVIVAMNYEALPFAVHAIFAQAFTSAGAAGGMLGAMIVGFQRAVFSNEAGIGSASIAHSAVRTKLPASEGIVALLEPFIDTVVVCTMTALVIVTTLYYEPAFTAIPGGVEMTSRAFERNIAWAPYPLAFAAMLFAFSTMISWAYYGLKGWTYLTGRHVWSERCFKIVYCLFVALGSSIQLDAVLDFSDALVFFICVPNILGMYFLAPVVKAELDRFVRSTTEDT